ncbi:unnamed protein product, partial [Mycena citricolor]
EIGTPTLHCETRGKWSHNIFTGIHAAFGTVISAGTKNSPRVIFKEDPAGWKGTAPVVVSFTVSAGLLNLENARDTQICLSVRETPASAITLTKYLGFGKHIVFGAGLLDQEHVHILPQNPYPSPRLSPLTPSSAFGIGRADPVSIDLDEECELIRQFTARVQVENGAARGEFAGGKMPDISQPSPCAMRLSIGAHVQQVVFPYPIIGSQNRMRLARKSGYIEVKE